MRRLIWTWLAALCLFPTIAASAVSQQGAGRVALVVGNTSYPDAAGQLSSTSKDSRMMAEEFRRLNFEVSLEENLTQDKMRDAVAAFMAKITPGTTAFFYFSGFGISSARESFLLPIDAQIKTEQEIWRQGVSVSVLLNDMHRRGAKAKVVIIDAARRNPFELRFRPSYLGLNADAGTVGTLALYSASPGMVVGDDIAARSLLVTELSKELRSSSLALDEIFSRARFSVARASNLEQVPLLASSLTEELHFSSSAPRIAASVPPPRQSNPEPAKEVPPPPLSREAIGSMASAQSDPGPKSTEPGSVFRDCADCPELVIVPAGSFEMGSATADHEKPLHRVNISKPFAIGRFEVTFKEWDACVEAKGCKRRPDDRGWGRDRRPVINISWVDAKEYVGWLSKSTGRVYRLPSEAEWEYAARGGTKTTYWWGRTIGERQAHCRDCNTDQTQRTSPVGAYKPNPFGIFDTSGNAAEWVEDCWNDGYRGAPTDGSAWVKGDCRLRALRGGAFDSQALYLRPNARFRYDADVPYLTNGFRVVRELP